MGRFGGAVCLAGGAVLMAVGVAIATLDPLAPGLNLPAGAAAAVAGLGLIAFQVWRTRPDRGGELIWTSILDAVLLFALVLGLLPAVAFVRGFVELFTQAHVHDARDAVAYDGPVGVADTHLTPPSVVVPEALLPIAGLALLIPLITRRRRLLALLHSRLR